MACPYNRMLLSNKTRMNFETHNNTERSQNNFAGSRQKDKKR